MNNADRHAERVRTIVERFNALLAELGDLGPLEPKGDDRNIYRSQTEVAFELGEHVLTLAVPDPWFEVPGQLDDYLAGTITTALAQIRKPEVKITSLSLVKAPRCDGCGEPMVKHDATRWICNRDECDQNTTPVQVDGVYPFTTVKPTGRTIRFDLVDGEPCDHPGCLSHVSHPCEGCGRTAGRFTPYEPRDLRAVCEDLVGYAKHGDLYDKSDLILELRAALAQPSEAEAALAEYRERWQKLEDKVAQAMGHATVARTAREAELVMKAQGLKAAGCKEHAQASGEMLLGVDEVRRAYAIFDALRSVQVWMKGYL